MGKNRKTLGENANIVLYEQVDGICPLCGKSLMYEKIGAKYKDYEVAHIYPLNPTEDEVEVLKNEERLHEDVNHEDNLIPLCKSCHNKYDKPRTVAEYRLLVGIKKELIRKTKQRGLWHQYDIEDDISKIIDSLYSDEVLNEDCEIEFEPREVDRKVNDSMTNLTKQNIKHNVTDYFVFIKNKFASLDRETPGAADIISLQVKHFYLKQKQMSSNQQEIYSSIVDWIFAKTSPLSTEAAEIITSFFVQNCEVFE